MFSLLRSLPLGAILILAGCPDQTINVRQTPPQATITFPAPDTVIPGNAVELQGTVADIEDAEEPAFPDGWDAGQDGDTAGDAAGAQPPAKQARLQVDQQSILHRAIACAKDTERMRRELDEERDKARERSPRLQPLLGDVHILAPAGAPLH